MAQPKYVVRLRQDGTVRIVKSDGEDIQLREASWIKEILTRALREQGLTDTFKPLPAKVEGIAPGGEKFDVDPFIFDFEEERNRQKLSRRALARALYCSNESKLGAYVRGRSRPHMDVLRSWAYLLQLKLLAVPIPLAEKVQELVKEWRAANPPVELVNMEVEE